MHDISLRLFNETLNTYDNSFRYIFRRFLTKVSWSFHLEQTNCSQTFKSFSLIGLCLIFLSVEWFLKNVIHSNYSNVLAGN